MLKALLNKFFARDTRPAVKFGCWLRNGESGRVAWADVKAVRQDDGSYDVSCRYERIGAHDALKMRTHMTEEAFQAFYRQYA